MGRCAQFFAAVARRATNGCLEGRLPPRMLKPVSYTHLNAEIAQTLLESEGVVVTRAANGNEVVDLYLSHPAGSFDAILMDIMMPGMDGYEATRTIRLSEKVDAADIPIIALTANAFAEDAKAAHDAGMNAHLSKPLDFNKLKNILARIKKNGSVSL